MSEATSSEQDPIERLLEVLVYAPVGAGLYARDAAPAVIETLVARGREEVNRRVVTARSLGQVAIAFGVPMLRQRVQAQVDVAVRRADDLLDRSRTGSAPEPAPVASAPAPQPELDVTAFATRDPMPSPYATRPPTPDDAPSRELLPIPGYDALSASQVVERLAGLGPDELDAVHAYEEAHRQRRTILGKIEQLAG